MYFGNRVAVDHAKLTADLNQTEYVSELLERFSVSNCLPVSTPIVQHLLVSVQNGGEKLTPDEHAQYINMVGSLLYLACWSRQDIAFAVSELSSFSVCVCPWPKSNAGCAKHQLRYLKGSSEVWSNVDSDCFTPSLGTVAQWVARMFCGDSWTRIGPGVQTAGGLPQAIL